MTKAKEKRSVAIFTTLMVFNSAFPSTVTSTIPCCAIIIIIDNIPVNNVANQGLETTGILYGELLNVIFYCIYITAPLYIFFLYLPKCLDGCFHWRLSPQLFPNGHRMWVEHMLVVLGAEHARDGRHGDTGVDLLGKKVACKLKGGRRGLFWKSCRTKIGFLKGARRPPSILG